MTLRRAVAALGLAAAGACGSDDEPEPRVTAPGPTPVTTTGSPPQPLPVLGQGVVTARYTGEVTVRARGDYAYTSSWGRRGTVLGNVISVWDVRADLPVLVDTLVVGQSVTPNVTTTGDVQVSDDDRLLVVATEPAGALVIYALDDPARPRLVGAFTTPNLAQGVHTAQLSRVGGTLYAFCSVDPRSGAPAKLVIVDLSDPASPREVWSQAMGEPFVHDVFVRDGVLLTANWHEGVAVWDIGGLGRGGSVTAPARVGAVRTVAADPRVGASVHNVWWLHHGGGKRYLIVGEELTTGGVVGSDFSAGDIHVVDVGDLSSPAAWREVATFRVPNAGVHNFSVDEAGGVLYAAYYSAGVRAVDVRGDLSACTAAQRTADGRCDLEKMGRALGVALDRGVTTTDPRTGQAYEPVVWGVEYLDGVVYASDMMGGLWKLRGLTR
jgi:hypothetical protein